MINANKETLNSFFISNLQYVVPFFQRSYIWEEENWDTLWEHISNIAVNSDNQSKYEHFIGTLITKQRLSESIGEQKLDLIDGQQRLTTFALLLKAIANKATGAGEYPKLKDKVNELVVFDNAKGDKFIRIEHSKNDKDYFEAIMFDNDLSTLKNQDHKILTCFRYFLKKLDGFSDEQLDLLKTIILKNVPAISMLLSANDDEQEIFDTINSLGVKLTTGELLKNYIFKEKELQGYYETHWYQVFEDDEEQIAFWTKSKTSGRISRTNIEVLLYCYLIIETQRVVELEKLFKEYKKWLQGKTTENKTTFLKELKVYTEIYYNFPEGTELNEISYSQDEKRFFHIIEKLEITTAYPLILYIYKQVKAKDTRMQLLKIIESYLVRRNVCRLTTKNYNNLFIQIISKLIDAKEITADSLLTILTDFTEDTSRFPSDLEFETAFADEAISNANAREILYCISLYNICEPKNDINKLSSSTYSVEHMMPQKWETNWTKPSMDEPAKLLRNNKLKTLGNLTLVTKSLNSSMKNAAWDIKKRELKKYSTLKITTDYIDNKKWEETDIDTRAKDLATIALKIWNR
ncbi:MAG TPA: DUF262 domain-containing HNH endonuclease family protein [Nitrospirota bacterium]|nr:DUF262 domain-containing HNH endonuclease family protein [Nitrospirota bacterium]